MNTSPLPTESDTILREYGVVVAIPNRLESQTLAWTLTSQGGLKLVRTVQTIDELLDELRNSSPRVLLMDETFALGHLPIVSRQFGVRLGECTVGVLADRLSDRQLHMITPNVSGVLSRDVTIRDLLPSIDRMAAGEKVVSQTFTNKVEVTPQKQFKVRMIEHVERLTDRQLEVLVRIAEGYSAKEVAQDLHVSEKSVESHKYRLMKSLGVRDRIALCRWAIREGIIRP